MTKGGIHAFRKSLSAQLIDRGIRVNAVAPGPVWTPLNPADRPPQEVAKFGAGTAMGRSAQPEEIAPAFVFMAAPSCLLNAAVDDRADDHPGAADTDIPGERRAVGSPILTHCWSMTYGRIIDGPGRGKRRGSIGSVGLTRPRARARTSR